MKELISKEELMEGKLKALKDIIFAFATEGLTEATEDPKFKESEDLEIQIFINGHEVAVTKADTLLQAYVEQGLNAINLKDADMDAHIKKEATKMVQEKCNKLISTLTETNDAVEGIIHDWYKA